jgi:hypothetical protein
MIAAPFIVVVAIVDVPRTAKRLVTVALFIFAFVMLVVAKVVVPVDTRKPVVVAFVVVELNAFSESTFMTEAQRFERTFKKFILEVAIVDVPIVAVASVAIPLVAVKLP